MLYDAKNGSIRVGDTDMEYISFGHGQKNLVMIPGLSDGLKTVKGLALPTAVMYRKYAKLYKVYMFSRKNHLEDGYTTREMAADLIAAMKQLGIAQTHILGISQGGMIAQYMAIDAPAFVDRLVLAVTLSRQNETVQKVIPRWIEMAESGDYKGLFIDTAEKSYSETYLKRYRRLYPILSRIGKPKDFSRFVVQAHACLQHNAFQALEKIACPVLVIGGGKDQIVGGEASEEIADRVPGSKLLVYDDLGHGAYTEAKDFDDQVIAFLEAKS